MSKTRRSLGQAGEELATQTLQRAGLTIVARNWRCAVGEVDIVAEEEAMDYVRGEKARWCVLVEVRTRRGDRFGSAQQSITARKASKLREVGEIYIQETGWFGPWRIDVVAIQMDARGVLLAVDHIRSAVTGA